MISKTITYEDFNGRTRTETYYFNLSKSEIADMELSVEGGMSSLLEGLKDRTQNTEIARIFREIIRKSYGVKTPDGRSFMKEEDELKAFLHSNAYSEMFMELLNDGNKFAEFLIGILPADVQKEIRTKFANVKDFNDVEALKAAVKDVGE